MRLIDSHSHLFLEEFAEDLPDVIARAKGIGVTHIFLPNIDSTTIEPMLRLCAAYQGYCFPMMGLHPTSVKENYLEELKIVAHRLTEPANYVAIGEIGLDLHWDTTYIKEQLVAFKQQVEWALERDLPVVIHCRDAFTHLYELLKPYKTDSLRGIFHSFTGTIQEATALLEFSNFYIGINGVVTYKNSTLPTVLPQIPLERVVLETDAPYLTPVPHRGKRNESMFIKDTLMKVAHIYGKSLEEVADITSENALKVFGMLK